MDKLIGREAEIQILNDALASPNAELIAVYGRRRVGKTWLIRTIYEKRLFFEFTGLKDATLAGQLENFSLTLSSTFRLPFAIPKPPNWLHAFRLLIQMMEAQPSTQKRVVFLDEFPWMDTPKSGFLAAFDHFWNSWASKQANLVVVICGSAAAWMIQNIVKNRGGLHNRITQRIRLLPFNLYETDKFLRNQRVRLDHYQVLQLFMVTGGVPQYLKDIKPGESVAQAVDRLCFTKDGSLRDEFDNLYTALFENADKHVAVVRALASKPGGMTRKEIMVACRLSSGGSLTKMLDELLESGFVATYIPFGKNVKEAIFKLSDEYSIFYLKFIENSKSPGEGTWVQKSASVSWRSWSALAFEHICLKHVPQIKKALGISGIYTEQSILRDANKDAERGVQIDLLIDRQDNCINIIEVKFLNAEFTIDKKYAEELEHKRRVFAKKTDTKKTIFLTMLTTFGVKKNNYYLGLVQNQVVMGILFERV